MTQVFVFNRTSATLMTGRRITAAALGMLLCAAARQSSAAAVDPAYDLGAPGRQGEREIFLSNSDALVRATIRLTLGKGRPVVVYAIWAPWTPR